MNTPAELKYDRTDKNGTEIYWDFNCPKCGGTGFIQYFYYVDQGTCFKCGGTGRRETPKKVMKYTPEYAAKLEEKRLARRRAKADEVNKKFLAREGFNADGRTYIVLGDTFKVKEELKKLGCKYSDMLGWHSDTEIEGYPTEKISVYDAVYHEGVEYHIMWKNDLGELHYQMEYWFVKEYVENIRKAYAESNVPKTGYIGAVGEKVSMSVTYTNQYYFDTQFGTTYVYKFRDSEGHIIIWKTAKILEIEKGDSITLTGTVKEQKEYRGEEQTVMTRCKIA